MLLTLKAWPERPYEVANNLKLLLIFRLGRVVSILRLERQWRAFGHLGRVLDVRAIDCLRLESTTSNETMIMIKPGECWGRGSRS